MSVSLALAITTGSGLAQNQSPDTATASATQDTTPRAGLVVSTPGQGAVSGNVVRRLVCLSVLIALAPAFMNAQNSGGAPGAYGRPVASSVMRWISAYSLRRRFTAAVFPMTENRGNSSRPNG